MTKPTGPRTERRGTRRRRVRWRTLVIVGLIAGGLAVVALGALDLGTVQRHVTSARQVLSSQVEGSGVATPEGRQDIRRKLEAAAVDLQSARRTARRSPALWAAWPIPGLHAQRAGLLSLIDDAGSAVGAARTLVSAADGVAARTQLREGTVPLAGLATLQTELRSAAGRFLGVSHPSSGLWFSLGRARRTFNRVARSTGTRLADGSDAAGAARGYLAEGGERRYLLAVENNAEMRDQGTVLSYALVHVVNGRLAFEGGGSIAQLELDRPVATPLPEGTSQVFGSILPNRQWRSVNASADFALSGRLMSEMYRQKTGQPIDGVMAIDVPALASLLRAVGPVNVEGVSGPVTADNVARLLLHDLYEGLAPNADQSGRREKLAEVAAAVIDRLTHGSGDAVAVGRPLGDAAAGGHLRLFSSVEAEERVFEANGLGGGPGTRDADRTFHLAVENRSATKVDYYVKPSVRQEVRLLDGGDAVVLTTVVIDNQAPAEAKPSYALGPDQPSGRPGNYLAWVLLWGPAGSAQLSGGVAESGLVLAQRVIEVGAGEHREVTFQTVIPRAVRGGEVALRWVPQPRLEPVAMEVAVMPGGGWSVTGGAWRGPAEKTRTLRWKVVPAKSRGAKSPSPTRPR